MEKVVDLLCLGSACCPLNTCVDVFGVFAEDHHIHTFGVLNGRVNTLEPSHGALANIEVERLAQSHIQRAHATTNWGCERALDADFV